MQLHLIGLCLLAIGAQAAEVYKSVDPQGHVTYSDQPLGEAVKSEHMSIPDDTPDPAAQQAAQERQEALQADNDPRRREQEEAAKAAAQPPQVVIEKQMIIREVLPPEPTGDGRPHGRHHHKSPPAGHPPSKPQPLILPARKPSGVPPLPPGSHLY